ncbi:MAG: hypothetical protein U9Q67_01890 [Patescibacteria group bacterium]|nr:hypothetical protein [Patescibacteria group bacterium]
MKKPRTPNSLLSMLLFLSFLVVLGTFGLSSSVNAADPTMYLFPESGYALLNQNFAVDIMLDSGGNDLKSTRAVFGFDPAKLQVVEAQHGELFCQYPEDEYSVDNENGWVMLTGFCQDEPYNSGSEPGLFGRITFKSLIEGELSLNFEFDGSGDEWQTWMLDTMSPPQQISMSTPGGGTYMVVSEIPVGQVDTSPGSTGTLPGVGIFDDKWFMVGLLLVSASVLVVIIDSVVSWVKRLNRDDNTVIIH